MIILDQMIRAGRFTEFVREITKIHNQELIDNARWEVWLHRIFDMSFDEYISKLDGTEEVLSEEVMEATIKGSMGIINDFCPE